MRSTASRIRAKARLILALAACVWAAVLLAAGLGMLFNPPGEGGLAGATRAGVGISLAAMGQFVFLVLVADRFFPEAHRRMVIASEALVFVLFLAGLASAAVGAFGSQA